MLILVKRVEVSSVYTQCLLYIMSNMHIYLEGILEGYFHRIFMTISLRVSLEQIPPLKMGNFSKCIIRGIG